MEIEKAYRRLDFKRARSFHIHGGKMIDVQQIAQEFNLSEQELVQESLRAFLLDRLQLLDSERRARCAIFSVTSLEEMDDLLKTGQVEEEDILEDFQHVDYLTTQIQRIRQLL